MWNHHHQAGDWRPLLLPLKNKKGHQNEKSNMRKECWCLSHSYILNDQRWNNFYATSRYGTRVNFLPDAAPIIFFIWVLARLLNFSKSDTHDPYFSCCRAISPTWSEASAAPLSWSCMTNSLWPWSLPSTKYILKPPMDQNTPTKLVPPFKISSLCIHPSF